VRRRARFAALVIRLLVPSSTKAMRSPMRRQSMSCSAPHSGHGPVLGTMNPAAHTNVPLLTRVPPLKCCVFALILTLPCFEILRRGELIAYWRIAIRPALIAPRIDTFARALFRHPEIATAAFWGRRFAKHPQFIHRVQPC
jgi:hypothetical protein